MAALVIYALLLLVAIAASVRLSRWRFRWIIWTVTGLLCLPGLVFLTLGVIFWQAQPPSVSSLQREYPAKRDDLETVLRMSNEDLTFPRIAPDFVWRNEGNSLGAGEFTYPDEKSGLPRARWDEYRRVYQHSGIKLGVLRDKWGDAFIVVDSIGLLNRGHSSGYLFCSPTDDPNLDRFEPCALHQDEGKRNFDPDRRQEAYSFKRLDSRWFAFDQGPS